MPPPSSWLSLRAAALAVFMACSLAACSAQPKEPKPRLSVDVSAYPFMKPEFNMLQFYRRAAIDKLYQVWKSSGSERLNVLMLGDSHLQSDIYPGQFRKRMHKLHGDAGRGLMFAFSTAKTYSSIEYNTEHTGEWTPQRAIGIAPKLPMGVRGMTCRTEMLPATLTFTFVDDVPAHYDKLRIYCKRAATSYDLFVEAGGKLTPVEVGAATDGLPYVEVGLNPIRDRVIKLHVVQKDAMETEFEFYGMSLESSRTHGCVVHNAGVGAARYNSILYQWLFSEQLPFFEPDVVVIDFGTNDYLYDDLIKPELEGEIRKVIATVRKGAPEAAIILTTAQDLFWKEVNCKSGEPFADLIHRIARDTDCAVFDWYWIAGAQGSMMRWLQNGLAQKDLVHLNKPGYQLKGNMLFDAVNSTMLWLDENPEGLSLLLSTEHLREEQAQLRARIRPQKVPTNANTAAKDKTNTSPRSTTKPNTAPSVPANGKKHYHTVANGESISVIARRHNVSIADIVRWNDLRSPDRIYTGQKLIIYKK